MIFGKSPLFAALSPKPHATGMRLISILTLDSVILTGILEGAVGAFNSIFTKEDQTLNKTKFSDLRDFLDRKTEQNIAKGLFMYAFEGDFSAFNRRINPCDLFLATRTLFTELMGEDCVLNKVVGLVEQSFSVKFLTMPFRQLKGLIEAC